MGSLLQSAARVLQSAAAHFYFKMRQVHYIVRQLLQSAAEIVTKCSRNYYKVRQLLQSAAIITNATVNQGCYQSP